MSNINTVIVDGQDVNKTALRAWLNNFDSTGTCAVTGTLTANGTLTCLMASGLVSAGESSGVELQVRPDGGALGRVGFIEDGVAERWYIGIKPADAALYFSSAAALTTPAAKLGSTGLSLPTHGTTASAANVFIDSSTGLISRSTSSLRYKTDVEDLTDEEGDAVLSLRPITYLSSAPNDNQELRHFGLIAEEVAEVDPRLVEYSIDENEQSRPESVRYERLCVLLLDVVQRLEARVAALEAA